jgi:hypothetical protein
VRGYGDIYTSSHRKLSVGERVPGYSGYMSGYVGYISGYSGYWGPETPDSEQFMDREQLPENSGYMSRYFGRLCLDIPD